MTTKEHGREQEIKAQSDHSPEEIQPTGPAVPAETAAPAQLEEVPQSGEESVPEEAIPPEVASMKKELEEACSRAAEYLDGWQRSVAEFANYKKRQEREREQVYQNAAGTIVKRYLEIIDDLERALKKRPQDGEGAVWATGVELIYHKFLTILETEGIKVMNAAGQPFDPTRHEAISQEDSPDHESGQIIDVVQNGYMLGERVLRPALVRIAR
jgi:molecular chaperone GrpE